MLEEAEISEVGTENKSGNSRLIEIGEKLSPLLAQGKLDNIVDLLSILSDVIEMADDALVQKLMGTYDEASGALWALGNAARYAKNQSANNPTPSMIGLLKMAKSEDVRKGLQFVFTFLSVFGKQISNSKDNDES